jgi:hypothetical protein
MTAIASVATDATPAHGAAQGRNEQPDLQIDDTAALSTDRKTRSCAPPPAAPAARYNGLVGTWLIGIAAVALVACHHHEISDDEERITVAVDARRSDPVVDGLNAELRELAAPEGPSAPPVFGFRIGARVEAMNALRGNDAELGIYLRAVRELSRRHPELTFQIGFDPDTLWFELRAGSCGAWDDAFDHFLARMHAPPQPSPTQDSPPRAALAAELPQIGALLGDTALATASYVIAASGALRDVEPAGAGGRDVTPAYGQLLDLMTGAALPPAPHDHAVTAVGYASTGEVIIDDRWSEGAGRDLAQLRLVAPGRAIRSSPRIYGISDLRVTRDRTALVYRSLHDGDPQLVRLELASLTSSRIAAPRHFDQFVLDDDGAVIAYTPNQPFDSFRLLELARGGAPRELARLPRSILWALLAADRQAVWLQRLHNYTRSSRGEYRRSYDLVRVDRKTGEQRTLTTAGEDTPRGSRLAKFDRGWYTATSTGIWLIDDHGVALVAPPEPDPRDSVQIAAAPDGLLAVMRTTAGPSKTATLELYRGTRALVAATPVPAATGLHFRNPAR